jgi:hypothetical protein
MKKELLSETAYEMLQAGKRLNTINEMEQIKKVFNDEGLPIFEKVVEFQALYGGISYKIGESFYYGFSMDLFCYDAYKCKYKLRFFTKENGKYFFQCMDYHYAGDIGPCIDEDGRIYDFSMGRFLLRANSIEEFLDDEAIKYYFVNIQSKWLNRGAQMDEIAEFKKTANIAKIERQSFSDMYFEWWTNVEESIFIRINLLNKGASVYCRNEDVLHNLYKENKKAIIYPR